MKRYIGYILIILLAGCKERFEPPAIATNTNYLVVEGLLNAGQGPTNITLSRTAKLVDSVYFKPERNAVVTVEGSDNSTYPLLESGSGSYMAGQLLLKPNTTYRLHIKTKDGKEYASDYVAVKRTPEIDSISWKQDANGVQLYANTHDPQNSTVYYKWDYEETWEIHSPYPPSFRYIGNGTVLYAPNQNKEICWKYNQSTNIIIGSSAKLQSDVIHESPLLFIAAQHEKLGVRYSMLVKQYALDKKAYAFYQVMKKNTESLGSIFDAQPSELRGNLSCLSNPDEPVIGYIQASTISQQRLFIKNSQLKNWVYPMYCDTYLVPNTPDSLDFYFSGSLLPYNAEYGPGGITGYFSATPHCVDCTLRGSNVKPSYW